MEIILNDDELKEVIHYCFCNGGLETLRNCDLIKVRNDIQYSNAKFRLTNKNHGKEICFEDVLIEILENGEAILFFDLNTESELNMTLYSARNNLKTNSIDVAEEILGCLGDNAGNTDGSGCAMILQIILFKQVIYG